MEPTAFGPKVKKMAQKDSWMLQEMFSGLIMTQPSHGIREGSKTDRPEEEKEKERDKEEANAEEEEDSSDQEGKGRRKRKKERPLSHGE